MLKDGSFFENVKTSENLSRIFYDQAIDFEKRICELSELADDVVRSANLLSAEGYGIYELLGIIFEGLRMEAAVDADFALVENCEGILSYLKVVSAKDKALLSEMITSGLQRKGISVAESEFLKNEKSEETFVYVKNLLADEAFDVFSQEFRDPRVTYASSFKEAARAVTLGISRYCLLPLEERGGARISSITSLLFSEDLKINSVTPVFGMDGGADMKYALVSGHFSVPEIDPEDDRYLEIRMTADSTEMLSDVLVAAETLGVEIYRVNTVTFDTDDGAVPYFSIVFRKNGESFSALLVYLTLFCSSYTAVGIYKNLE